MATATTAKAGRPKKPDEPAWQRNSRIENWKRQQYAWVVYTPGPEPSGYITQLNEVFAIISGVTPNPQAARKWDFEHAVEVVRLLKAHNRQAHTEYVGPKHQDEKSLANELAAFRDFVYAETGALVGDRELQKALTVAQRDSVPGVLAKAGPTNRLPQHGDEDLPKRSDAIDEHLWQECQSVTAEAVGAEHAPSGAENGVNKRRLGTAGGCQVYLVSGDWMLVNVEMDWHDGDNYMHRPKLIPKGEVWLDDRVRQYDWPFNCYHEITESRLMEDEGLEYDPAHKRVNGVEWQLRQREGVGRGGAAKPVAKGKGQPCKPGETAARSECTPQQGPANRLPSTHPSGKGDAQVSPYLGRVVSQYRTYDQFNDPAFNTPGRRWPRIAAEGNRRLGSPQDYELRMLPIGGVTPSQSGEDYLNDSSRELANTLRGVSNETIDLEDTRPEDLDPILVDSTNMILDGNHRHAAHTLNGDQTIAALVPVGPGTGKIRNMRQVYDALSGSASNKSPRRERTVSKGKGQPCKPGETAAQAQCVPRQGPENKLPAPSGGTIGAPDLRNYADAAAQEMKDSVSTVPGEKKPAHLLTRQEYSKLPKVYRGVHAGSATSGAYVFITPDADLAGIHGTVHEYRLLPGAKVYADPEIEEEMLTWDETPNGTNSLERGSAIVARDDLGPQKHEWAVDRALSNGEPVPENVLAQYPKLRARYNKTPSVLYQKGKGQPCKPGETAERSGCVPLTEHQSHQLRAVDQPGKITQAIKPIALKPVKWLQKKLQPAALATFNKLPQGVRTTIVAAETLMDFVAHAGHALPMTPFKGGKKLALAVAQEQGFSNKAASRIGDILGWIDFGFMLPSLPFHAAPIEVAMIASGLGGALAAGKVAGAIPVGSLAYVGLSAAAHLVRGRNPVALIAGARARVKASKLKVTRSGHVKPRKPGGHIEPITPKDIEAFAAVSDAALDQAYHYGRAKPGSFGEAANRGSARRALGLLANGTRDEEKLAAAIHEGWAEVARTFDDPVYTDKPGKRESRLRLAGTPYGKLPEDEKEKDRVAARALRDEWVRRKPRKPVAHALKNRLKGTGTKWRFINSREETFITAFMRSGADMDRVTAQRLAKIFRRLYEEHGMDLISESEMPARPDGLGLDFVLGLLERAGCMQRG